MELISLKTRTLRPPKDNLFDVIDEVLIDLRESDVVVITSKIVAIHEGRCVPIKGTDKEALVRREADALYNPDQNRKPLTIVYHALISAAGIDESNGKGYYVLLPQDAFKSAETIHAYLKKRHGVNDLGIIITDSHSLPFRYGAMSIAIGCWGFKPLESHIGRTDLFGRVIHYSKTNIPDSIAAATTLVTGECDESRPITIVRNIPNLVFTDADPRPEFFVQPEDDIYRDLYRDFEKLAE